MSVGVWDLSRLLQGTDRRDAVGGSNIYDHAVRYQGALRFSSYRAVGTAGVSMRSGAGRRSQPGFATTRNTIAATPPTTMAVA